MTINAVASYQITPLYSKSTTTKTSATGEPGFTIPETVTATPKNLPLFMKIFRVNTTFELLLLAR